MDFAEYQIASIQKPFKTFNVCFRLHKYIIPKSSDSLLKTAKDEFYDI